MDRDHKFRGKRLDNGEWVYGAYYGEEYLHVIFPVEPDPTMDMTDFHYIARGVKVIPETVGECIFKKDACGCEIYEDDVVREAIQDNDELGLVTWDKEDAQFVVEFEGVSADFSHYYGYDLAVVGNIHDSPELLQACGR